MIISELNSFTQMSKMMGIRWYQELTPELFRQVVGVIGLHEIVDDNLLYFTITSHPALTSGSGQTATVIAQPTA